MNEPTFTGLVCECVPGSYETKKSVLDPETGTYHDVTESHPTVRLRLGTAEYIPQSLRLDLRGAMAEELIAYDPCQGEPQLCTAYLHFTTYTYSEGNGSEKLCQRIQAWRLDFFDRQSGQLLKTITRPM